jgi:radical SAM-linked protein
VRIRFCKQGDLRWIGHRDLMRCLERLFRRADLPLRFSAGFHPKPRMTFPTALAVGIESADEVMELELSAPADAADLRQRLAALAPPGLEIRSVAALPEGSRKVRLQAAVYEAAIPLRCRAALVERIADFWAGRRSARVGDARRGPTDLRPLVAELRLDEGTLRMRLPLGEGPAASPRDVLTALGLGDLEQQGVCLRRTALEAA